MDLSSLDHIIEQMARHTATPMHRDGSRRACVLVPLIRKEGTLHLLLTKRAETVEHHKGQISFPGGMVDDGDASASATALRELEEETGVPGSAVTILGTLDDIFIPTGFTVTPVVGYIASLPSLCTNAAEVADVLLIPLSHFLEPARKRTEIRFLKGANREITVYDVWKEPVWGATAHIIEQFVKLLEEKE